jgi:hypothetical protein
MAVDVGKGVFVIEGFDGQRIGIRTDAPTMEMHVGEGAASWAGPGVGIGVHTPSCWLEVRSDVTGEKELLKVN